MYVLFAFRMRQLSPKLTEMSRKITTTSITERIGATMTSTSIGNGAAATKHTQTQVNIK